MEIPVSSLTAKFDEVVEKMNNVSNSSEDSSEDSGGSSEDDSAEEMDDKMRTFFLESFKRNKSHIEKIMKSLDDANEQKTVESERLFALTKLSKEQFKNCAWKELDVFKQHHGQETLHLFRKHITKLFQTKCQLDPSGNEGKWFITTGPSFRLYPFEIYCLFVLQELITKACQEFHRCTYRQATMRMFKGSPYHLPIFLNVSKPY